MPDFRMPSLGADMEVGSVLEWLVQPGDVVHHGDVVAVVDTAKAAVEVEVFSDGVVDELLVPVGQTVPVGTLLATLRPVDSTVPAGPPREPERPPDAGVPVRSPLVRHLAHQRGVDLAAVPATGPRGVVTRVDVEGAAAPRTRDGTRSSPYARRRAAQLDVDLRSVTGTGRGGAIRATDVELAAGRAEERPAAVDQVATAAGAPATGDRRTAARQAIAALMTRSKREVPHYYLTQTIDLAQATDWLHEHNRDREVSQRVLPAALLVRAVALACRTHPSLNGFWRDDRFDPADDVHVGSAVALRGGGLVTPALLHADRLSVAQTMAALRSLVERSRAGRLRLRELTDGTITVTNLGERGAESVLGVVFPPQVALVGFGRVAERPWAVDGLLGVRPLVTASLAADHRATDGHVGSTFLAEVDRLLQDPDAMDRTGT